MFKNIFQNLTEQAQEILGNITENIPEQIQNVAGGITENIPEQIQNVAGGITETFLNKFKMLQIVLRNFWDNINFSHLLRI